MTRIHDEHRLAWRESRLRLEDALVRRRRRSSADGERRQRHILPRLIEAGVTALTRALGLYARGRRNARDLGLTEVEFRFPHLPPAFDGYRILHLSDLHVGIVPDLAEAVVPVLSGIGADLLALTGDYQTWGTPDAEQAGRALAPLLDACRPADGMVGVLGNHDGAAMVDVLEGLGVRMLVNESLALERAGQRIRLVGLDDVHAFYTPAASAALASRGDCFALLLVHSVELAHEAEAHGYSLLLSGHTHGGQICLPGGRPVITALDRHRRLAKGAWRMGRLQGYTSSGTGSSAPAIRFNSRPEIVLVTLRRG